MALVLIDTSAWIFNFPPKVIPAVRERIIALLEQDLAAVASPILFELLQGSRSGEQFRQVHQHLSGLHPFPMTESDWLKAAQWASCLRLRGITVKTMDFLIAYKAMRHKLTLLHADADFDRLARVVPLRVESFVRQVRSAHAG